MNDLQHLVGLKMPEAVSWWPLALGWYLLALILLVVLLFFAYKKRQSYLRNQYRREALKRLELLTIEQASQLFSLLKQTLLQASIKAVELSSEQQCLALIEQGVNQPLFNQSEQAMLLKLAYQNPKQGLCSDSEFQVIKVKSLVWLKEHDYAHLT